MKTMGRRGEEEKRRRGKCKTRFLAVVIASFSLLVFSGCGPNPSIVNSGKTGTPPPVVGERPASTFEKDLEAMRTANFEYIYALRRTDGGKLDSEDKKFIRANSPDTNRNILSDDDKALLAGSNFPIPPERLKALQDRFDFQDYSAIPMPRPNNNVNSNVNAKDKRVVPVK
jgi:hypothetical protein